MRIDRRCLAALLACLTLALALRRVRRFDEAAVAWGRLLALPNCPRGAREKAPPVP